VDAVASDRAPGLGGVGGERRQQVRAAVDHRQLVVGVMDPLVVRRAEQYPIVDIGVSAVCRPFLHVMHIAPGGWSATDHASAVAGGEGQRSIKPLTRTSKSLGRSSQ
jgi:hypothetical protein